MFSLSHRQFRGDLALAAGQSGFFFLSKEVNLAGVCQNQCFCIWGPSCLFFFSFCCMPWPVCGGKKTTWRSLFFPSTMSTGLGSWYQYPLNPQPPWPSSSLKWSQIKLMQHWFQLTAYSWSQESWELRFSCMRVEDDVGPPTGASGRISTLHICLSLAVVIGFKNSHVQLRSSTPVWRPVRFAFVFLPLLWACSNPLF